MACILTNKMLLENMRSVSQFIPSMLSSFVYFFYLDVQVSTDVRAIDGLIGAVILNSQSYITSANVDYIPLPPFGECHVQLCTDLCYGDDDPTQWAQPYSSCHSHLAAMPRPNTLLAHQIIWWTPSIGDFVSLPLSGLVSGLGKLCPWQHAELGTSVNFLINRMTEYKKSIPAEWTPPNIQLSVKWLQ